MEESEASRALADPGFAPRDLTDRRARYEWASGYPTRAKVAIYCEAIYLLAHLLAVPALLLIMVLELPVKMWPILDSQFTTIFIYAAGWLGGTFGGSLFAMKWHYHVVAKGLWHADRRLWRLSTPYLSGGLAFVTIVLIRSNILRARSRITWPECRPVDRVMPIIRVRDRPSNHRPHPTQVQKSRCRARRAIATPMGGGGSS